MANKYSFNIEWSDEDQEYVATCPAFPGLSAFGETEEEALREGKVALVGFVETCHENGIPLPEPAVRSTLSGKLQLRLPKSLHRQAVRAAEHEGVSLNSFIADAVRTVVTGQQYSGRFLNELRMAVASVLTVRPMTTQDTQTTKEVSFERTVVMATAGDKRTDN